MYSQGWQGSREVSSGTRDFVYSAVAGASSGEATGLGITNPTQYYPLHSTVSCYAPSGEMSYVQSSYREQGSPSKGQTIMQPGLPPTPQTAGLPPDLQPKPQQVTSKAPRPSSVRQIRQPKRLRPKGVIEEAGRPIFKRRRSSITSQTSNPTYPPAASSETQAEKLREEQFFAKLRQQNVPWKEIVKRYEVEFGKSTTEAALQMKRKRLRDSLRVWNDSDVS